MCRVIAIRDHCGRPCGDPSPRAVCEDPPAEIEGTRSTAAAPQPTKPGAARNIRAELRLRQPNFVPGPCLSVIDSDAEERKALFQFFCTCPGAIAGRKLGFHKAIHFDGVTRSWQFADSSNHFVPFWQQDNRDGVLSASRPNCTSAALQSAIALTKTSKAVRSNRFDPGYSRMGVRVI
jgi:hypothetical protein